MDGDDSVKSLIHPQGKEAAKKNSTAKSKAKAVAPNLDEVMETFTSTCVGKVSELQELKSIKENEFKIWNRELELNDKEMVLKDMELALQVLNMDTSTMPEATHALHEKLIAEVLAKF
ncbi:hypothetical protein CRG98_004303 [Punica granatum]|uniref:Uncharacterized protein n=1 Tax=Punica granatum TaxID=22663 RepID=A0A2I0L3Q4_PUNGR|nr:hypothetical protein CRG98_004303 [Punica granatum]